MYSTFQRRKLQKNQFMANTSAYDRIELPSQSQPIKVSKKHGFNFIS